MPVEAVLSGLRELLGADAGALVTESFIDELAAEGPLEREGAVHRRLELEGCQVIVRSAKAQESHRHLLTSRHRPRCHTSTPWKNSRAMKNASAARPAQTPAFTHAGASRRRSSAGTSNESSR